MTRLLFIGDIVGKPGRELVRRAVPALVIRHEIDLVIVNGENAAAGFGITPDLADDLFEWGVHVITGGNHTWDKKEIFPYFAREPRLVRPANLPAGADTAEPGGRTGPRRPGAPAEAGAPSNAWVGEGSTARPQGLERPVTRGRR